MNGYLVFLKSLSQYQQRAEIGRLAFTERWGGSSLQKDILKVRSVSTFSQTLGVNPLCWKFDLKHYAEEPDLFGIPVFRDAQCTAPFSFRYAYLSHNLSITGTICVYDDGSAVIGALTAHTSLFNHEKSRSRLVSAGIDPRTAEKASHPLRKLRH